MEPLTAAVGAIKAVAGAAEVATATGTAVAVAAEAGQAGALVAGAAEVAVEGATPLSLGEVTTVAAEMAPNPTAAAEISGLAKGAAESSDVFAGRSALEKVAEMPDGLGAPNEGLKVEVGSSQAEVTPIQEATVQAKTESSLQKWESENPKPDAATDPEAYKKWCESRDVAEVDYIIEVKTDLLMKDWDKNNPEPNKATDSEKHKEWEKKRADQKEKTSEKIKKETKDSKAKEMAAVLAEINRLRHLYQERVEIIDGINAMRRKSESEKTDQDKIDLAKFQVRKAEIEGQISAIEADLKAKAGKGNPLIALMVTSALASMLVYKAAKEEKVI